ncbi:MAG TPA: AAA family ATPase, partial [Thermoanaerobaculia bacterium]
MTLQISSEAPSSLAIENMTPRQIVAELDKYVVGQKQAKRAVAIALRNRWRRQQLPPELAEDIAPKNILMIGPTGVGKTEIARRLARLARAPFLKVEASKFTEVGYVGRDVESMVRDLVEIAVTMVREERREAVRAEAATRAEDRLLQLLVPPRPINAYLRHEEENEDELNETREKFRKKLRAGALDGRKVEIEVDETPSSSLEMFTPQGVEEVGINIKEMLPGLFGRKKRQQVTVAEAREILQQQETEKLIDRALVAREARQRVEQGGLIFLDEIDKIAGR